MKKFIITEEERKHIKSLYEQNDNKNMFNKAAENDPKAYWVQYRKAVCLDKLGKKQDAIATAEKSMALAKEAKNDDYVKLNEDLIKKLK